MATIVSRFISKSITNGLKCQVKSFKPILSFALAQKFSSSSIELNKAYIQKPAPHFESQAVSTSGEFVKIKLSDYQGKYLVFFFYPLDFTYVCPTEIIAFSDRIEEFKKINCELLACSVDSVFSHLAWNNQPRNKGGLGKMSIPILSDLTKQISRDYGVLLEDAGISLRGLFIIDHKGILRQITVNDLPVGRSVDETLRLVQAFQFVDKHGEVCPAGWKPGSDTIKPGVKESQEYFSKH
ncbi:peroxiredoxin prdx-2 isoform X1 [Hydra vulgaris]|uniref:peroxiredoxin prdx-2 isoform X1 n=1 Tax=Hydra vulgaris TaxID=6087 RepID=UPI0001924E36|nr:peroxiredoxin prdx-2-like [Hydra vulgaris]